MFTIFDLWFAAGIFVWGPLLVWFFVVMTAVAFDSGWGATGATVICAAVLYFITGFNPLQWIAGHPWEIFCYASSYLGGAVVWAIVKWWFFVRKKLRRYVAARTAFITNYQSNHTTDVTNPSTLDISSLVSPSDMTPEMMRSFKTDNYQLFSHGMPPQASQNKSMIMVWMTWWPICLVWTMIEDLVHEVFIWLYEHISGLLQKISDRIFAKYKADFDALSKPSTGRRG